MSNNMFYEQDTPFWELLYSIANKIDEVIDRIYPAVLCGGLFYLLAHTIFFIWRETKWLYI